MTKKIIVDTLMFICMLLEFSRIYIPPIFHEIIGIVLAIFFVIHLWFNRFYIKSFFKGKYNLSRAIMAVINVWFFISFICCIIFWILSSQDLLTGLNIHNMTIVKLHKMFGYIWLIFMWLHLWINIWWLVRKINKAVFYIVWALIFAYWIYAWIKLDIRKHIIWEYWFSFVDWNIALYLINHLSVVLMITFVTNILYNLLFVNRKKF